jgi:hypothetical protein
VQVPAAPVSKQSTKHVDKKHLATVKKSKK